MNNEDFLAEIAEYEDLYEKEREEWELENNAIDGDGQIFEQHESSSCDFPLLGISLWDGLVWTIFQADLHESISDFNSGWDIDSFCKYYIEDKKIDFDLIAYIPNEPDDPTTHSAVSTPPEL